MNQQYALLGHVNRSASPCQLVCSLHVYVVASWSEVAHNESQVWGDHCFALTWSEEKAQCTNWIQGINWFSYNFLKSYQGLNLCIIMGGAAFVTASH